MFGFFRKKTETASATQAADTSKEQQEQSKTDSMPPKQSAQPKNGNLEKLLIQAIGRQWDDKGFFSPYTINIRPNIKSIETLVKAGADVNCIADIQGMTPFPRKYWNFDKIISENLVNYTKHPGYGLICYRGAALYNNNAMSGVCYDGYPQIATVFKAPALMILLSNLQEYLYTVTAENAAPLGNDYCYYSIRKAIKLLLENGADPNCRCSFVSQVGWFSEYGYEENKKIFSVTPVSFISRYGYGAPEFMPPESIQGNTFFNDAAKRKRSQWEKNHYGIKAGQDPTVNQADPLWFIDVSYDYSLVDRGRIISSLLYELINAGADFTVQDVMDAAGNGDVADRWATICTGYTQMWGDYVVGKPDSDKFQNMDVNERAKIYRNIIDCWIKDKIADGDGAIKLVLAGADIKTLYEDGGTILHQIASSAGAVSPDLPQILIDKGLDINAKNKAGESALCIAAKKGFVSYARWLIEHGADKKDALSYASTVEMVEALSS